MLNKLFKDNGLIAEDVFKHQHYTIITRAGIDKIQAKNNIQITYELKKCEPTFAVIKAYASLNGATIQTYGSALKGNSYKDGNTNTHYVVETAEKRAMSRAVLKLAGLYSLGVFGEDESESFKKSNNQK